MPENESTRPGVLGWLVAAASARPWLVLLVAAMVTLAAGWSVTGNFAMTTASSALLSPDVAWRVNERRLDAAFPQNGDVIIVVVDGKTPELAENAAAGLASFLATDTTHFRRIVRPDGGPFFARAGLLFLSHAEVSATTARLIEAQPLLGPLAADPSLVGVAQMFDTLLLAVERGEAPLARFERPMAMIADALETEAAGQPAWFSWSRLFDAEGAAAAPTRKLLLVRPKLDFTNLQPGAAAADAIRTAAAALKIDAAHGLTVRLTGSIPLDDEEFSSLADNPGLVAAAIIVSMLGVLWTATRSWPIVTAIMVSTLAGLAVTAALGLALVGRFNLISVAFIPLFVGLGVDFGIQLGFRFQAERAAGAAPAPAIIAAAPAPAIIAAAAAPGSSLLLAAAAICLGFLAFLPTAHPGIAELGIISSVGMVVALVFSATLLPALLVLLRPATPRPQTASPRLATLDALLIERRKTVLIAFGLLVVATIAALPLVRFDFNPLHLKSPNGEAVRTLDDLIADPDRSPNTIDILAPSLAEARALAARLEPLPDVARVLTVESFVPQGQAEKLPIIADANALLEFTLDPIEIAPTPDDAAVVAALRRTAAGLAAAATVHPGPAAISAQRLAAAFEALAAARPRDRGRALETLITPLGTLLGQLRSSLGAEPVTLSSLPAGLKRDWLAADGRARVRLSPKGNDNAALERFTAQVRAAAPDATGAAVSTQEAATTVATAFVQAGALALLVVSLLLFAVWRSVREVAFTLAPVVLSGFLTLGTCVIIGQAINFANIIAFPLLFGVGVAFHIHVVMAWRGGASNLLQSSLARGVLFSALATGMAFGSLWLSSHTGTASMGKILMIALAWTLVCALIFEPALLGPQKPARGR